MDKTLSEELKESFIKAWPDYEVIENEGDSICPWFVKGTVIHHELSWLDEFLNHFSKDKKTEYFYQRNYISSKRK